MRVSSRGWIGYLAVSSAGAWLAVAAARVADERPAASRRHANVAAAPSVRPRVDVVPANPGQAAREAANPSLPLDTNGGPPEPDARARADDALSREIYHAELGDGELHARVEELTRNAERWRRAFEELSERRREALGRGDFDEAERVLSELMRVAQARRTAVSELTDATFEATCRTLPDCGADARSAYFDMASHEAPMIAN